VNELEKNKSNWDQFATHFNEINNDFLKKIKSEIPEPHQCRSEGLRLSATEPFHEGNCAADEYLRSGGGYQPVPAAEGNFSWRWGNRP